MLGYCILTLLTIWLTVIYISGIYSDEHYRVYYHPFPSWASVLTFILCICKENYMYLKTDFLFQIGGSPSLLPGDDVNRLPSGIKGGVANNVGRLTHESIRSMSLY